MKRTSLLALFALAACATVSPAPHEPTAGFGQIATLQGIRVRPVELLEDSRCPILVRCIWEGRLRIRAEVSGAGGTEIHELTLGEPIAAGGGTLTLVDAQPRKRVPESIERGAYRFTFRFEPAGYASTLAVEAR